MHEPDAILENETYKILWDTNGSPNPGHKVVINENKRTCHSADCVVHNEREKQAKNWRYFWILLEKRKR